MKTKKRERPSTPDGELFSERIKAPNPYPADYTVSHEQMMRDAVARQKNIHEVPPSAWDPNHPENSP